MEKNKLDFVHEIFSAVSGIESKNRRPSKCSDSTVFVVVDVHFGWFGFSHYYLKLTTRTKTQNNNNFWAKGTRVIFKRVKISYKVNEASESEWKFEIGKTKNLFWKNCRPRNRWHIDCFMFTMNNRTGTGKK